MITAIQELLNSTGRAIIPELGCLSINDENQVVFNPFLKFNDGKLIAWLVSNEGLDENQAQENVSAWAKDIQEQVLAGKEVSLGTLGRFFLEGKDYVGFSSDGMNPVGSEMEEEKTVDDYPQLKNVYIPPVQEDAPKDLDAILNKTEVSEDSDSKEEDAQEIDSVAGVENSAIEASVDREEQIENDVEPIEASHTHDDSSSSPENEVEEQNKAAENDAALGIDKPAESVVPKPENEKSKNQEKTSEEVTVNRKRSPFFYINIVLFALIVGLGAFAFIYADEVSEWLGISAPKTELVKDSIPNENQNEQEALIEEPIEETETLDYDATPVLEEVQQAPEPPKQEAPKVVEKPKPESPIQDIPAVAASGDFHIIVGKFAVKENADRLVQKIRDAGYDGKILRSTSTGHTVSFHTYPTLEDANNNINKAKEISGTGAYVEKK
jgi:cell division septation protein DedD